MYKTEISFLSILSYFTAANKKGKKKLIKFRWSVSSIVKISMTTLMDSNTHVG